MVASVSEVHYAELLVVTKGHVVSPSGESYCGGVERVRGMDVGGQVVVAGVLWLCGCELVGCLLVYVWKYEWKTYQTSDFGPCTVCSDD